MFVSGVAKIQIGGQVKVRLDNVPYTRLRPPLLWSESERPLLYSLGEAVLKYRQKAGLSQEALAEKADIHPNYVGRIERGECAASLEVILKIAKALGVRPYRFLLKL